MHSTNESSFAQDAESAMRAAARVVLEASASGHSKKEILGELEQQGISLPDPEDFVERLISASAQREETNSAGEEPDLEDPPSRQWLFAFGGFVAAVALSWGIALLVGLAGGTVAGMAGKLAGVAAGGGLAYWARERGEDALFAGVVVGLLVYILSSLIMIVGLP